MHSNQHYNFSVCCICFLVDNIFYLFIIAHFELTWTFGSGSNDRNSSDRNYPVHRSKVFQNSSRDRPFPEYFQAEKRPPSSEQFYPPENFTPTSWKLAKIFFSFSTIPKSTCFISTDAVSFSKTRSSRRSSFAPGLKPWRGRPECRPQPSRRSSSGSSLKKLSRQMLIKIFSWK